MNKYIINIALIFFYAPCIIFAMEPYDSSYTFDHDLSKKTKIKNKITEKQKTGLAPDAVKAKIATEKQKISMEKRPQEKTKSINTMHLDEQKNKSIDTINLSGSSSITQQSQQNAPLTESTNSSTSVVTASENLNHPSEKSTHGATESKAIEFGKEKLQSRYEQFIQDALKSSFMNSSTNTHDFNDFLNKNIEHLAHYLLDINSPSAPAPSSLDSFNREFQYISNQIVKYGNSSIYTNIDVMLSVLQQMNIFIKESHLVTLSKIMIENMDKAYKTASITSDKLKTQNIIFDTNLVPDEVKKMFAVPLASNMALKDITNSIIMIQTVYNKNGLMEQVIKTFERSMIANNDPLEINQYYIEFLTFALIFQNTIGVVISILHDASEKNKLKNSLEFHSIS